MMSLHAIHLLLQAGETAGDIPIDPAGGIIYLLLGGIIGIVAVGLTIWFLVHPGEKGKDHVKRRILRERDG